MKYFYLVMVPMPGGAEFFEVAKCATPDHAACVVRILLEVSLNPPATILIRLVPAD